MVSRVEFVEITAKIERDCRILRKAIAVIYIEFGAALLVAVFHAGVAVGKTLCR